MKKQVLLLLCVSGSGTKKLLLNRVGALAEMSNASFKWRGGIAAVEWGRKRRGVKKEEKEADRHEDTGSYGQAAICRHALASMSSRLLQSVENARETSVSPVPIIAYLTRGRDVWQGRVGRMVCQKLPSGSA